jgi:hypothetical protein
MDNPLARLAAAIRKLAGSKTVDEKGEAGKEGAQVLADQLPEVVMTRKALTAAEQRRKMIDQQMEDANK